MLRERRSPQDLRRGERPVDGSRVERARAVLLLAERRGGFALAQTRTVEPRGGVPSTTNGVVFTQQQQLALARGGDVRAPRARAGAWRSRAAFARRQVPPSAPKSSETQIAQLESTPSVSPQTSSRRRAVVPGGGFSRAASPPVPSAPTRAPAARGRVFRSPFSGTPPTPRSAGEPWRVADEQAGVHLQRDARSRPEVSPRAVAGAGAVAKHDVRRQDAVAGVRLGNQARARRHEAGREHGAFDLARVHPSAIQLEFAFALAPPAKRKETPRSFFCFPGGSRRASTRTRSPVRKKRSPVRASTKNGGSEAGVARVPDTNLRPRDPQLEKTFVSFRRVVETELVTGASARRSAAASAASAASRGVRGVRRPRPRPRPRRAPPRADGTPLRAVPRFGPCRALRQFSPAKASGTTPHSVSPYAAAKHATRRGPNAGERRGHGLASEREHREVARGARGTSAAGTPASIVGVVSACVARDSARHEPRLSASRARRHGERRAGGERRENVPQARIERVRGREEHRRVSRDPHACVLPVAVVREALVRADAPARFPGSAAAREGDVRDAARVEIAPARRRRLRPPPASGASGASDPSLAPSSSPLAPSPSPSPVMSRTRSAASTSVSARVRSAVRRLPRRAPSRRGRGASPRRRRGTPQPPGWTRCAPAGRSRRRGRSPRPRGRRRETRRLAPRPRRLRPRQCPRRRSRVRRDRTARAKFRSRSDSPEPQAAVRPPPDRLRRRRVP